MKYVQDSIFSTDTKSVEITRSPRENTNWNTVIEDAKVMGCIADETGNIHSMTKSLDSLVKSVFRVSSNSTYVVYNIFSLISLPYHQAVFRYVYFVLHLEPFSVTNFVGGVIAACYSVALVMEFIQVQHLGYLCMYAQNWKQRG